MDKMHALWWEHEKQRQIDRHQPPNRKCKCRKGTDLMGLQTPTCFRMTCKHLVFPSQQKYFKGYSGGSDPKSDVCSNLQWQREQENGGMQGITSFHFMWCGEAELNSSSSEFAAVDIHVLHGIEMLGCCRACVTGGIMYDQYVWLVRPWMLRLAICPLLLLEFPLDGQRNFLHLYVLWHSSLSWSVMQKLAHVENAFAFF